MQGVLKYGEASIKRDKGRLRPAIVALWLVIIYLACTTFPHAFAEQASGPATPAGPIPRCPQEEVTDQVLFEDPSETARKLYLPRYRLAMKLVSSRQQYRARLEPAEEGGRFIIYLEKYPAPELGDQARDASEISHELSLVLKNGHDHGHREFRFQEVAEENGLTKAVLKLGDQPEVDRLYRVLTNSSGEPALLARRTITVRAPASELSKTEAKIKSLDAEYKRCCEPLPGVVKEICLNPRQGGGPKIGSAWLQIGRMIRPCLEIRTTRDLLQDLKSKDVEVTRTLDQVVKPEPFVFPSEIHPYVYAALKWPTGDLIRHRIAWQDGQYSYFQNDAFPNLYYYLPDRFVIAKPEELPDIKVRFSGNQRDTMKVTLDYRAIPFTDPQRLEKAKSKLAGEGGNGTSQSDLKFEPLKADEVELLLDIPGGSGNAGRYQVRSGAFVDLVDGISDRLVFSLEDFHDVYNALFGGAQNLFTGWIKVHLEGFAVENVPFEARVKGRSKEEVWEAILDQTVRPMYQRRIEVKTFKEVLTKRNIKTALVEFEDNDTVELRSDQLRTEVDVALPLVDYMLNRPTKDQYRYKVTVIYQDQPRKTDEEWRVGTMSILYPEL